MCLLSWNLGASTSWNPQGLSRPVMWLLKNHCDQSPIHACRKSCHGMYVTAPYSTENMCWCYSVSNYDAANMLAEWIRLIYVHRLHRTYTARIMKTLLFKMITDPTVAGLMGRCGRDQAIDISLFQSVQTSSGGLPRCPKQCIPAFLSAIIKRMYIKTKTSI